MSDDFFVLTVSSTVSVIIGVLIAFVVTWLSALWNEQKLRKKYCRIFLFELQQLQKELNRATSSIRDFLLDPEMVYSFPDDARQEMGMLFPEEALPRYHFKADYAFLRQNFEKISIFQEEIIKSLIKINTFIEEYDTVSGKEQKILLIQNLQATQKEIENALALLQKEEKMGIFR